VKRWKTGDMIVHETKTAMTLRYKTDRCARRVVRWKKEKPPNTYHWRIYTARQIPEAVHTGAFDL
jgi:hypothetical protein